MHDLASKLAEAGVNIKVIQELCGHSSSDVTLDIYAAATKELKQREFGNFEERMKQQKLKWKKELVMKQKMRGSNPSHLIIPTAKKFFRCIGVHRYIREMNPEKLNIREYRKSDAPGYGYEKLIIQMGL